MKNYTLKMIKLIKYENERKIIKWSLNYKIKLIKYT